SLAPLCPVCVLVVDERVLDPSVRHRFVGNGSEIVGVYVVEEAAADPPLPASIDRIVGLAVTVIIRGLRPIAERPEMHYPCRTLFERYRTAAVERVPRAVVSKHRDICFAIAVEIGSLRNIGGLLSELSRNICSVRAIPDVPRVGVLWSGSEHCEIRLSVAIVIAHHRLVVH